MQKIPVAETIAHAYGLSFRRYLTVAGIVWLPVVAILALTFVVMRPLSERMADIFSHMGDKNYYPDTGALNGWIWLLNAVNLLLLSVIASGITKDVLGTRRGSRLVYFALGKAEWMILGNFVLLYVVSIAIMVVAILIGAVLGGAGAVVVAASGQSGTPLGKIEIAALIFLALVIAGIASFYVFIRLAFFAVPVSVAEGRIALFRSWEMTRGNVWRIVGILIATLGPVVLAEAVIIGVMLVPFFASLIGAVGKGPSAMGAVLAAFYRGMWRDYAYLAVPGLLLCPILYGLMISPPAFAYRALVPAPPEAPPSA